MAEPEERAGWRMHTAFAGDTEVGTETTIALRFGWGVCQKWQGPGSLLPSFLWVHWPQILSMLDDAMAMLAFLW